MTYAEMDRIRKQARSFYLELRALDLEPYAVEDQEEPMGYGIRMRGLESLSGEAQGPHLAACRGE